MAHWSAKNLFGSLLYTVRPKSFETSCFKRVLCVISSVRHHNYIVLCFMSHVTRRQRFSFSGLWVRNCFASEDFLPCHRCHGGAEGCLVPGSSFNGTRWTFLGKYHYRWRNMVFRLWSGHQTTECRVGGAKLSKNQRKCDFKNREWRRC